MEIDNEICRDAHGDVGADEGAGLYDLTPALCRLDYTMSEAGGVTNFERQYTLASGGPYCDCGYKKKGYRKTISHLPRSAEQEPHAQQDRKEDQVG